MRTTSTENNGIPYRKKKLVKVIKPGARIYVFVVQHKIRFIIITAFTHIILQLYFFGSKINRTANTATIITTQNMRCSKVCFNGDDN